MSKQLTITYNGVTALLTKEAVIERSKAKAIAKGVDPDRIYSPDGEVYEPTWFAYFEEALEEMLAERGLNAIVEIQNDYTFTVSVA